MKGGSLNDKAVKTAAMAEASRCISSLLSRAEGSAKKTQAVVASLSGTSLGAEVNAVLRPVGLQAEVCPVDLFFFSCLFSLRRL